MSFQAYLKNIETHTGKTILDIQEQASLDGLFQKDLKATQFVSYMKETYDLGKGHSMALWKYFIDINDIHTKHTTISS